MIFKIALILLLSFLGGCSSEPSTDKQYAIGRDPTWFPVNFKLQTGNVNAFSNSLVGSISRLEQTPMFIFDTNWITLFQGLEEEEYDAVFTPLPVNQENQDRFTFSDPFLLIGPVLVVPETSKVTMLSQLRDKRIGINQYDDTILIVQKFPAVSIKLYQNMPLALEELAAGRLDGVLINTLQAHALVPNLYPGILKIVTPPLSDKGLRLVTLKGKHEKLIEHFNLGLEKMRASGQYGELREKFALN
ncbi:MAG: Lysine/arginine/ornithine-binding periplasmic protein [Chlamydiales bacterium]|nr:Lysine/arginine/ornithine-binding periplasmic protein [Chlamydiales bacterium]MCH9619431.1 Lysine/arginine/ornithine-binding periplasmic protein [Chlamydiales bacterium]MCH9622235.1 Lysine/arginine/ornithine-binding periplasmic protein [Chlamydiales bacterium]